MIHVPDLLHHRPRLALDTRQLEELLGMAFLGRDTASELDEALAEAGAQPSSWKPELFASDLFLDDLLASSFPLRIDGRGYPLNKGFLVRVLTRPPMEGTTVRLRQEILRELADEPEMLARTRSLFRDLFALLSMFKAPGSGASLDITAFRLDILGQIRRVIDEMAERFADARSELRRLSDAGREIQETEAYGHLKGLLEYQNDLARLQVEAQVGLDGSLRRVTLRGVRESTDNPFYQAPWRRFKDLLLMAWRGYGFSRKELAKKLVHEVYRQLTPTLLPIVQLLGHLEVYLAALGFAQVCRDRGLEVSLAEIDDDGPLVLEDLFNPLLFRQPSPPVPCDLHTGESGTVTLVTGPNSGGKTRLLQAVALAQLLGQSGLYVPARKARIPVVPGLFASLFEHVTADQLEGRLGSELLRIRTLFESVGPRSMVIVDELCSGTNPSEAEEIFSMVLRLLERLRPVGFITTHFLDYARSLEARPPIERLRFLQVEMHGHTPTYRFLPGVGSTSLAGPTARRLGVTFEELATLVDGGSEAAPSAARLVGGGGS